MKTNQKILITGANCFIGKYLSEFLLRKKFELRLLIRNDKKYLFNFWRLTGRLLKRADLLIYLSLEK